MTEKYIVTMNEYYHARQTWLDGKDKIVNHAMWWKWIQMGGKYAVHDNGSLMVPQISYRRIKALQSPHWKALLKAMEIQDADSNQG